MSGRLRWTISGTTPDLATPDDPNARHDLLNEQRLWLEVDPAGFLAAALADDDVVVRIEWAVVSDDAEARKAGGG